MLEAILSSSAIPIIASIVTFLAQELRYNRGINIKHKQMDNAMAQEELKHVHQIREDAQEFLDEQMSLLKKVLNEERERSTKEREYLGNRISQLEGQNSILFQRVSDLEAYNQILLKKFQELIEAKDKEVALYKQKLSVHHEALLNAKRAEVDAKDALARYRNNNGVS